MKQYNIFFKNIKSRSDFYTALKQGLELPDWFGANADALWDMLTGHMEFPAVINIKGWTKLPSELDRTKKTVMEVFQEAANYYMENNYKINIID